MQFYQYPRAHQNFEYVMRNKHNNRYEKCNKNSVKTPIGGHFVTVLKDVKERFK
jgi:hypothetical protein